MRICYMYHTMGEWSANNFAIDTGWTSSKNEFSRVCDHTKSENFHFLFAIVSNFLKRSIVISMNYSWVKGKRVNLKTELRRKQSTPNFSKNEHFLPPDAHTYVCVLGGKKCSVFGKFGVLCFPLTSVLRFTLLLDHRRIMKYHDPFLPIMSIPVYALWRINK